MRRFAIAAILAIGVLYAASAGGGAQARKNGPSVVTTTGMIADVVRNLAGDLVDLESLMGPGVDPHLYRASAGDVRRLSGADLILYNGLHLEAKMGEVFEQMTDRIKTLAVAEAIPQELRIHAEGFAAAHDPHIWFDVQLWSRAVEEVWKALLDLLPEHSEFIQARYEAYSQELAGLDAYVRERISQIPEERRVLVTAHDAFGYFGKAYGLEVWGLQGISTVAETGTDDVQQLATLIAAREIPAIFVETSVPARSIEALQAAVRSRGFEVSIGGSLFSDAMGPEGSETGTYLGMVRHNVDTIARALIGN